MSLNEENDAPPWGVCSCKPTCTAHSSLIHGQAAAEIPQGKVQVMGWEWSIRPGLEGLDIGPGCSLGAGTKWAVFAVLQAWEPKPYDPVPEGYSLSGQI